MTISARPTDKLIERWLLSGPLRRPGASNDVLNQFEQENAVALPADMRDFFARLDGSGSYFAAEGDRLGFSFWSITRVRRAREELNARRIPQLPGLEDYFFFADYLSWSWAYAIRLVADASTGDSVLLVGQEHVRPKPPQVARSFAEFVDVYLEDSPRLYGDVNGAHPMVAKS